MKTPLILVLMLTPKQADQMYKTMDVSLFCSTRRSKVEIKFGGPELASDNRANRQYRT